MTEGMVGLQLWASSPRLQLRGLSDSQLRTIIILPIGNLRGLGILENTGRCQREVWWGDKLSNHMMLE